MPNSVPFLSEHRRGARRSPPVAEASAAPGPRTTPGVRHRDEGDDMKVRLIRPPGLWEWQLLPIRTKIGCRWRRCVGVDSAPTFLFAQHHGTTKRPSALIQPFSLGSCRTRAKAELWVGLCGTSKIRLSPLHAAPDARTWQVAGCPHRRAAVRSLHSVRSRAVKPSLADAARHLVVLRAPRWHRGFDCKSSRRPHGEGVPQPFIIENRSGAEGDIGTQYVARANPDGHTLLVASVARSRSLPSFRT